MKSILDKETRNEIVVRIESLNKECKPQWGKMNVAQMVKHCSLCEQLYLGKTKSKRVFLGRIFGQMALRKVLSDDKPLGRNSPTAPMLAVSEEIEDLEAEKQKWITLIKEYEFCNEIFVHPFFGKMTKEQLGKFVYKHCDHHLRQFCR